MDDSTLRLGVGLLLLGIALAVFGFNLVRAELETRAALDAGQHERKS